MHGLILLILVIIAASIAFICGGYIVYEKGSKQVWGGVSMIIGITSLFALFFYAILHYS